MSNIFRDLYLFMERGRGEEMLSCRGGAGAGWRGTDIMTSEIEKK